MKLLKKNQIIIYSIVALLMLVGYLNYSSTSNNEVLATMVKAEAKDDIQIADIGDATLVNSSDIGKEDEEIENENTQENKQEETTNEENIGKTIQTNTNGADQYFVKSKLERDAMYSQMVENYEKVLNGQNTPEIQRQTALQEITKINETKNSIMICENLIKTKGFENNVIFVNNQSINIIIGMQEMKQEEIAQIQNIITRELKAEIENIHISIK